MHRYKYFWEIPGPKASVCIYETTWCYFPKYYYLNILQRDNLVSFNILHSHLGLPNGIYSRNFPTKVLHVFVYVCSDFVYGGQCDVCLVSCSHRGHSYFLCLTDVMNLQMSLITSTYFQKRQCVYICLLLITVDMNLRENIEIA